MIAPHPSPLAELLAHGPYQAYSYSYPHKSAYGRLDPPRELARVWADEDRSALFAYVHIPFCTMRCGFCNLFAMARPQDDLVQAYVDAVIRQMHAMHEALGERRFVRLAFGGGTPSYLAPAQLAQLYAAASSVLGIDLANTPSGIEVSPETVTRDRLAVCRDAGVGRVSMGIQSFTPSEVHALARPQQNEVVTGAIGQIRRAGFAVLNLDLIYGIEGQTLASWLFSIDSAIAFRPEEIYLYPLYVRQQTGLGKMALRKATEPADSRLALYEAARARLRDAGYLQVSMRMFRAPHAPQGDGPVYCCQTDGMVGFGAGARSYTSSLHYASSYAVDRPGTRQIIEDFIAHDAAQFAQARHGFTLDREEQQRRFVIQSLLTEPGLDLAAYRQRFGTHASDDLPQLSELTALALAEPRHEGRLLSLNARGMAYADTIGPWLVSDGVRERMAADAC